MVDASGIVTPEEFVSGIATPEESALHPDAQLPPMRVCPMCLNQKELCWSVTKHRSCQKDDCRYCHFEAWHPRSRRRNTNGSAKRDRSRRLVHGQVGENVVDESAGQVHALNFSEGSVPENTSDLASSHCRAQAKLCTEGTLDVDLATQGPVPFLEKSVRNPSQPESSSAPPRATTSTTARPIRGAAFGFLLSGALQLVARCAVPMAMSVYARRHSGAVKAGSPVALLQSFAASSPLGKVGTGFALTGAVSEFAWPCVSDCVLRPLARHSPRRWLLLLTLTTIAVSFALLASTCEPEMLPSRDAYSKTFPDSHVGDQPAAQELASSPTPLRSLPELNELFQKTFRRNPEWSIYSHPTSHRFQASIKMADCRSVEGGWELTKSKAKQSAFEHALRQSQHNFCDGSVSESIR